MLKRLSLAFVICLALAGSATAQSAGDVQSAVALFQKVRTVPNLVYVRANGWEGKLPNRAEIARAASPLTYVRPGLPPIISIHGDADPTVPYNHPVRLQDALQKAGVAHELVTIPGGGHGSFMPDQWQRAYAAIEKFLAANVPAARPPSTAGRP